MRLGFAARKREKSARRSRTDMDCKAFLRRALPHTLQRGRATADWFSFAVVHESDAPSDGRRQFRQRGTRDEKSRKLEQIAKNAMTSRRCQSCGRSSVPPSMHDDSAKT